MGASTLTERSHQSRGRKAGRELIAALAEVRAAVLSGDPHRGMTVREVEIPDPGEYGPAAVKALRAKMGASVAVFARLVGVTPAQVEHSEQGRRVPSSWPLGCWTGSTPTRMASGRT